MTFPRQIPLLAFMAFLGLVLSGCQPSDPDSPNVVQLRSIAVTPNPLNMVTGGVASLIVTGTLQDNSTYLLNSGTTFVSSAPSVATVGAGTGYVTAVAAGDAIITATHTASGLTATTAVTVSPGSGGGGEFEDITFDSAGVDYTLTGFGGADGSLVPDPTDGSNIVARLVKSATAELWAGVTVSTDANLSVGRIPFTTSNTRMTVRVYSPRAGIPVRLKVEDASDDTRSVETEALTTQVNTWETLTFNFANQASGTAPLNLAYTYDKVSIFFDFGKTGADGGGGTFHFDDIVFVAGSGAGSGNTGTCTDACIDFASASVKYQPFEGLVSAEQSDDPVDASNKVAKFVKGPDGQPWAGATVYTIDATQSVPEFDLSGSKIVTLRVYSPTVGMNIRMKLEDAGNNAIYLEKDVLTTKANEWETLSFDFATPVNGVYDPANTYDRVSLFPAFSVTAPPASNVTVYFDELDYTTTDGGGGGGGGSGSTGTCAPTNCTDFSGGGIGFNVFENPGGGTVELAEDPNDPMNDVVKFVKKTGDNDFFGTVITGLAGPATLTTSNKTVTLRVYSPAVGTNFLFKLENGPGGAVVEKDMVTTVAGGWETLSFDLSAGAAGTYSTVVIFPNGRSKVTTDKTMYIDELKFPAAGGGGGGGTAPTDAPTTVIPGDAITIYSDAASVAGLDPFPFWGQNPPVTSSEVTIAGNKSLKYVWPGPTGLYQGIDWNANPVDVSAKGKLHIDFWTPDVASVKVSIISPGLENAYTQVLTTGGWNSVDIDLSNYPVPNLANIIQIKLEPASAGTLYVDNIYFWGTGSSSADCTGGTFTGGVFAADYRGSLNPADGKPPLTTLCGDIGFFYDPRLPATAQFEFGGIANQVVNPGGINNFYYGFGLQLPAITDGYFGAYVNAPANGIANVSSFTNLRFTLWGPAELFEKSFTPQIQVVMAGPVVAGCGSNSGRSEIQAPLVNGQKIGAASNFVVPLSSFTLKFACSGETTVAEVLAKVAQVNFSLIGPNIQYSVPDTSTPPAYSNGLNVGPISFN